ncbi:hypothetical protein [Thiomicrorhabdus sediminis]|uniref:Uncharacterized protein n=1 Tax=Thiomicrorhabdus sediminis TaxID=2580412 RepID=A0A4P9K5E2_9GAMM|nr:hypothetical protein [Thiomicrorhabdus sediminis]QCU90011.1 hypothetical protein FE785_04870 [Thiomicrorhabdus sediminis]
MKILDQNLNMSAQHSASQQLYQHVSRERFINGQLVERNELQQQQNAAQQSALSKSQGTQKLSDSIPEWRWLKEKQPEWFAGKENRFDNLNSAGLRIQRDQTQSSTHLTLQSTNHTSEKTDTDKPRLPAHLVKMLEVVEAMMERFTGKPFKISVYGYERSDSAQSNHKHSWIGSREFYAQFKQAAQKLDQNFDINGQRQLATTSGQRLQFQQTYQELETSRFQAKGHVTTADGRQIDFNMDMLMQRQFIDKQSLTIEQGVVFKDPLVVNFGGQPAQLTVDKFAFDIDADGNSEAVSFVAKESGFLALDKNQDGQINNGAELFGALSGQGFEELSAYDDDNNGWIDENDAVFSQLQIWHQTTQGYKQLSGLLELNIGAISLEHAATPFALKDENNQQHGRVTDTGIYLQEDGKVGSIQQIDLVV